MQKLKFRTLITESESETSKKGEISVPLILNNDHQINLTLANSKNARSIKEAPIVIDKDGNVIIDKNEILKFFKLIDFSTAI